MYLNDNGLKDRNTYLEKGYELPSYDRDAIRANTINKPEWIHFGAGNIFRAFQGNLMDRLLSEGSVDTGLIVCEGYDYEIIEKMYKPHDDLSILVTLKSDGTTEKKVIGSIVESLVLNREDLDDFKRLEDIFESDSLKMCSFTITEKGYVVKDANGELLPAVKEDIKAGPLNTTSYMGKIVSLLYKRYQSTEKPVAFV